MIEIGFKYRVQHKLVRAAVREGALERMMKFGERVVRRAKQSMRWSRHGEPSRPGRPPHRQTGTLAEAVIAVAIKSRTVVQVGIDSSSPAAKYGFVHELGNRTHPRRAFIRPAFDHVRKTSGNILRGMNISNTKAAQQLKAKRI